MYLAHFGLREFPFCLTPDTDYFFPGEGVQAALNTLLVALETGEGLIKITGEVGSGKTLLCRYLLNRLETMGWSVAYIPNPNMSPSALSKNLLKELGGKVGRGRDFGITKALENQLIEQAGQNRKCVAMIDEAQAMPLESLEALRLITNLETEKRKLLQIVLFGQPELDARLDDPSVRQIKSRIAFHDRLLPLTRDETPVYLNHRCAQAGATSPLFVIESARKLYRLSQGVPRILHILAHKSLLLAFGEGRKRVDIRHVRLAARDTPGASLTWRDRLVWLA